MGDELLMGSAFTDFRDWFVLKVLPLAIGIVAGVVRKAADQYGLMPVLDLIKPIIQTGYEKAIADNNLKLQAIYVAVLSKLLLVDLAVPGTEVVVTEEEAATVLAGVAAEVVEESKEEVFAPFTDENTGGVVYPFMSFGRKLTLDKK